MEILIFMGGIFSTCLMVFVAGATIATIDRIIQYCPTKGFFKAYVWSAKCLVAAFPLKRSDPDPFVPSQKMNDDVFTYKLGLFGFGLFPFVTVIGLYFLIPFLLTTKQGLSILACFGGIVGLGFLAYFTLKLIAKIGDGAEKVSKVLAAAQETANEPKERSPSTE